MFSKYVTQDKLNMTILMPIYIENKSTIVSINIFIKL